MVKRLQNAVSSRKDIISTPKESDFLQLITQFELEKYIRHRVHEPYFVKYNFEEVFCPLMQETLQIAEKMVLHPRRSLFYS